LEFRVAGHLGRDPVAANDIRSGFDVHKYTASNLSSRLSVHYSANPALYQASADRLEPIFKEVTDDERQDAKPETFRPLYGGNGYDERTSRYADAFRARWKGIADTQQGWAYDVLRTKQLRTESGLIFYWPDTKLTRSGYITNTTSIYNYPVQSFATAEIIPVALVYCWHRMRIARLRSFLVNTIHDSIIGEIHPDERESFTEIAKRALTTDTFEYLRKAYRVQFSVPLGCEIKIGPHWADKDEKKRGLATEEKYDLDPAQLVLSDTMLVH
jgi:DNA polymerase I-like protein with 3'-5' exonuclease and polymerase domains